MRTRTTIRTFDLRISDPFVPRTFVLSQQLDKDILSIKGFYIRGVNSHFVLNGWATAGLIIDNQEIFPDNTCASIFSCSGAVPGYGQFFRFLDRNDNPTPEPVKTGRLEFRYSHRPSDEEVENHRLYLLAQAERLDAINAISPAVLPDVRLLALDTAVAAARRILTRDYDVQLALLVAVND